jgi:transcriptional regulator with XRE-family HTH domain
MESFGDRLTAIREELDLSQIALARSIGISQGQLSKLEKGTRPAGADVIDKIAAALQRPGLDLVRGTDREGAYTAARVTPDDQRQMVALRLGQEACVVVTLRLMYERIIALFDAISVAHSPS